MTTAYGCTELASCIAQSGVRDKDAPPVAAGTLLANVKIQFLDEDGKEVTPGQPGEIVVSTPTIMLWVFHPNMLPYAFADLVSHKAATRIMKKGHAKACTAQTGTKQETLGTWTTRGI